MYTLGDICRKSALNWPDRTALVFESNCLTYRQLDKRVNQLANALLSSGIGQTDRLAVLSENTHKYLEIYFAASKMGISVTPLNFRLSDNEIQLIVNDSESTVLFVGEGYEARAKTLKSGCRNIRIWISMDCIEADFLFYEKLLEQGSPEDPRLDPDPEAMAILMYTGGTTGLPKGVMMSHKGLMTGLISVALQMSFSRNDATCFVLPLFHVSFWPAFSVLMTGGKVVIIRRPDIKNILRAIQDEKCTHINAVPTLYGWMLQAEDLHHYDLSSLRLLTYAGSPFPPDLLKQSIAAFGPKFEQAYGMTECIGGSFLNMEDHEVIGPRSRLLSSAGKPSLAVDIRIVGDQGNVLPAGEVGEVVLRGRCLMMGYWKQPELSRKTVRDGWYHTGDMGYIDKEGFLFLVDRKADMIVTGGENVYPKEVENVLYDHPAVTMAAVVSAPDEKWGERVQAVVVLQKGASVTEKELLGFCKAHLSGYKCPRKIEFWESLPVTPVGKILRKNIKKKFWEGIGRSIA